MNTYYDYTERYNVDTRINCWELLASFKEYHNHYFLEYENEVPSLVSSSRCYLEAMNPRKKVWILALDTTLGHFKEIEFGSHTGSF